MRRVGWDVDRLPGADRRLFASERGHNLAFEDRERLLEIVPMRRRPAAGRNMHVDQTVTTGGVLSREEDRVSVSYHGDVRLLRVVSCGNRKVAVKVVCGNLIHKLCLFIVATRSPR